MITRILSYLLHHANREYRSDDFYRIKNKILTKYGKPIGFDVQFIEGKKCRSCGGTGTHDFYGYDWKGFWKRWYKFIGRGWYCHRSWWWSPRRWPNNIAHIIRYKSGAIPFKRKSKPVTYNPIIPDTQDLPF